MIRWPDRYKPEETSAHVRKEIEIAAPAEAAWRWIARASLWPTWFPEFTALVIEGGGPDLELGSRFVWKAYGARLSSIVEEFAEPERIGWTAKAPGIDAYHAWLIERLPTGCRVISEETQRGWVARLNNAVRPGMLAKIHGVWLERLAEKAVSGPP